MFMPVKQDMNALNSLHDSGGEGVGDLNNSRSWLSKVEHLDDIINTNVKRS